MASNASFLRQLSGKDSWKSKRWGNHHHHHEATTLKQMEYGNSNTNTTTCAAATVNNGVGVFENEMKKKKKKRVMVLVDESSHSKHAMMWALTHLANNGDFLSLLHILPNNNSSSSLATSLASLCKASKPQVEVEAIVVQGPKEATVMSQVKKLEVSVFVIGQKNFSPLFNCVLGRSRTEEFVEQCINTLDCLTIGVRKQSGGVGGYLISTRWQKNFWLLA